MKNFAVLSWAELDCSASQASKLGSSAEQAELGPLKRTLRWTELDFIWKPLSYAQFLNPVRTEFIKHWNAYGSSTWAAAFELSSAFCGHIIKSLDKYKW